MSMLPEGRAVKYNWLTMPLFDQVARADRRPRRQNESSFDYMNTSARPGIGAIRNLLEKWFDQLPEAAKADIRGRFRDRDDVQHKSSFYELFWYALLRCSGYDVEIHPTVANVSANPDFLAGRNGVSQFYLEATLAMPAGDPAAGRRLAELHDTLDRMNSPDYFLEFEYRGSPEGNIRGRALRERLERWLQQLNFEEISRLYQDQNHGAIPTFPWSEQGLSLTFSPIPMLRTHDDIRASLEGKATKYGDLELPLIVAVNVMDDFCDDDDLWNALFGEEQFVTIRQHDGQWRDQWGARVPNGAWHGRAGARNTLVSAVAFTHQLSPSNLRNRDVDLIHNPCATHPLPADAFRLSQRTIAMPNGQIHRQDGISPADLLCIPEPWPIPDDEKPWLVSR